MPKPHVNPRIYAGRLLLGAALLISLCVPGERPRATESGDSGQQLPQSHKASRTQSGVSAFDGGGIRLRALPRNTQQIKAFYEARGFPKTALAEFENKCFITVSVRNHDKDIVWMEPSRWHYRAGGRELARLDLDYWNEVWERIKLAPGHRATFRWTQLPASRDLHPSEPVGGNIALPYTDQAISIEAEFARGADKSGEALRVKIENLRCEGANP